MLWNAGGWIIIIAGRTACWAGRRRRASPRRASVGTRQRTEGVGVRVGRDDHPMDEDHNIQWIELCTADKCSRVFLRPGEAPEAVFSNTNGRFSARAYCTIHGLWRSDPTGSPIGAGA